MHALIQVDHFIYARTSLVEHPVRNATLTSNNRILVLQAMATLYNRLSMHGSLEMELKAFLTNPSPLTLRHQIPQGPIHNSVDNNK